MARKPKKKIAQIKLTLKEKDQLLKQAGVPQEISRLVRNRSNENVMKEVNKALKKAGKPTVKPLAFIKEFKSLLETKTDTREAVAELYKEKPVVKKVPPKQKKITFTLGEEKVLILWKDVTENVDKGYISDVMDGYKGHSLQDLLSSARGWMDTTFGEIGQWVVMTVHPNEYRGVMDMYTSPDIGYHRVYYGQGKDYKHLLEKIHAMFLAIYQSVKKELFLREVIREFMTVNPPVAQRLARDFDIQ